MVSDRVVLHEVYFKSWVLFVRLQSWVLKRIFKFKGKLTPYHNGNKLKFATKLTFLIPEDNFPHLSSILKPWTPRYLETPRLVSLSSSMVYKGHPRITYYILLRSTNQKVLNPKPTEILSKIKTVVQSKNHFKDSSHKNRKEKNGWLII